MRPFLFSSILRVQVILHLSCFAIFMSSNIIFTRSPQALCLFINNGDLYGYTMSVSRHEKLQLSPYLGCKQQLIGFDNFNPNHPSLVWLIGLSFFSPTAVSWLPLGSQYIKSLLAQPTTDHSQQQVALCIIYVNDVPLIIVHVYSSGCIQLWFSTSELYQAMCS